MNKNEALNFANNFIDDIINTKTTINLNKPFEAFYKDEILENDPNLEILKSELNKIGYDILKTDDIHYWTISKINK